MKSFVLLLVACSLSMQAFTQQQTKEQRRAWFQQLGGDQQRSSGSFTYMLSVFNEPYEDLVGGTSVNAGEIWDDPEYIVPLPFPFEINGSEINTLFLSGFGALLLSPTSNPDVVELIVPFEADLLDRGALDGVMSLSPISYVVEGTPGNRIFKLEWKNAGSFDEFDFLGTMDMFVNIQLWLYEGSNMIEFRYGPSFISDGDLFYSGAPGAFIGIASFDIVLEELFNVHFITGPADNPMLSDIDEAIDGTPVDGMVFRFFLPQALEVTIEAESGTCGLNNGSATADANGGAPPYEYLWSTGEITASIIELEAGIYSVTVTDSDGASASASVEITNVDPLAPNTSAMHETAPDANDGVATADPTGGTPPYTYAWSTGSTDQTITDLAPGDYTVTVTDDGGCVAEETVTVQAFTVCPELLIVASLSNVNCFGECNVGIEVLDVIDGTGPFTYLWNDGSTDAGISDLCAGTYSVTVTDALGCVVSDTFEIVQPDELFVNAGSTNETAPDTNDGTAWAAPSGGVPPYSYAWSNGSMDSLITDLEPGTYTVTVTDANNCTAEQSVDVLPGDCNVVSLEAEITNPVCYGACDGNITVAMNGGTPPVLYVWSTGDTSDSITGLCAGTYTVTATDAIGCEIVGNYEINQPEELLANAGSTNETELDLDDGTAWAAPTGGTPPYSYSWSNGSMDSLITDLAPGDYTVTVTDDNGCTAVETVTVLGFGCDLLVLEADVFDLLCYAVCDGGIAVTVLNATEPVEYLWSTGSTQEMITGLCADAFSVTVTDANDCVIIGVFEIVQPEELLPNAGSTDETAEDANDGTAWAAPSGGTAPYTYEWSTGEMDSLITDLAAGDYTVTVTDAAGCTAEQTVSVQAFECILSATAIFSAPSCAGFCDGGLSVLVTGLEGPFTFDWSTGDTTSSISGLCAGTYDLTVTDVGQGCSLVMSFTLEETDPLLVVIEELTHITDSTEASVTISVSGGTPPYAFSWTGPGGFESDEQNLTGIAEGLYSLEITDANGCVATVDSVAIIDETVSTSDPRLLDIRVYPNPAHTLVYLQVPDVSIYHVELRSADGRRIHSGMNVHTLDVVSHTPGIYLLRVTSGERHAVYRLVIAR